MSHACSERLVTQADRTAVLSALRLIFEPGQVTELRALEVSTERYRRHHTVSGYFDDFDALAKAAASIAPYAKAVYVVPNVVNPALLARAQNRARDVGDRDPTTSDNDILARRWLLIDADPARPAGIGSTETEHEAALAKAREIRAALVAAGWPEPILADSGNGAHLMWRVDLPRDDEELVKRCLGALAFRFDDAAVGVDQTVFNPARIWKLYGTPARKGDDTAERPHRLSRMIECPAELAVVPCELLKALAGSAPKPPAAPASNGKPSGQPFDLDKWIVDRGLDVLSPRPWQGGRRWVLRACVWNAEHTDRSAWIVQFPSGAIAAGCQHNSCQGRDWHALRDAVEPGWRDRKAPVTRVTQSASAANGKAEKPEAGQVTFPTGYTAQQLMTMEFPEPRWAIPGILPVGLNILAGRPKMGKSFMAIGIALAIGYGGRALGQIQVERGEVLYLALEDRPQRLKGRLQQMLGDSPAPPGVTFFTEWQKLHQGGLGMLTEWLEQHTATRLVIVDTLYKIRPPVQANKPIYDEDYRIGETIKRVADDYGVSVLVVHHLRKNVADDPLENINGSFGLTGAADGVLVLQRERGKHDATIYATGRDVEDQELAATWDRELTTWSLAGDAESFRESKDRTAIRKALTDSRQALTPREVSQLAKKPYAACKQLMWRMAEEGKIKGVGEGRYMALATPVIHCDTVAAAHAVTAPLESVLPVLPVYPEETLNKVSTLSPGNTGNTSNTGHKSYTGNTQSTDALPENVCMDCGAALVDIWDVRCPACETALASQTGGDVDS